jgi:hypothetical protein
MMSASVNSTMRPCAAAIPALRADARPVYGPGRWRTNGLSAATPARYSAVPSVELESATTTSNSPRRRSCASSEGITWRSVSRRLYVGTTTEMRGVILSLS